MGIGFGVSLWGQVQSLFVLPLTAEFGWTRGQIAQLSAVSLLTACFSPLIGMAADRWGVRRVLIASYVGLGFVFIAAAMQTGSLGFYAAVLLASGITGIGTTAVTWSRPIVARFRVSRGLALAIAFAGVSMTGVVAPPLLHMAIEAFGWRGGLLAMTALYWTFGLGAVLLTLRGDAGLPVATAVGPVAWPQVFATPAFGLLLAATFLVNLGGSGLVAQFVPLLSDRGLATGLAAGLLSAYSASILIGRLATGLLLDRGPPPLVAAVAMLAPAAGCLLLAEPSLGLWVAATAVVLIGLAQGAETDVIGVLLARHMGQARYSALFGVMMGAVVAGNSVGSIFIGRTYDATGGYAVALWGFAAAFTVGAALLLALWWCRVVDGREGLTDAAPVL